MKQEKVYFADILDRVERERCKLRAIRDIFVNDDQWNGLFWILDDCIRNLEIPHAPADIVPPRGAGGEFSLQAERLPSKATRP